MSYGIETYNASGNLCFSTITGVFNYHYLGQATYTNDLPGFGNRLTRYTINSPDGMPMAFIALTASSRHCAIKVIRLVSGTTYEILILDASGSGTNSRIRPPVYCFGPKPSVTGADYGFRIYDASGNVTCDSTKSPLIINKTGSTSGTTDVSDISSLAVSFSALGEGWSSFYEEEIMLWSVTSVLYMVTRNASNQVSVSSFIWYTANQASSVANTAAVTSPSILILDMAKYL